MTEHKPLPTVMPCHLSASVRSSPNPLWQLILLSGVYRKPTDGMVPQNFNSNKPCQHWISHLGESRFFGNGRQSKKQSEYRPVKFHLPNHLPLILPVTLSLSCKVPGTASKILGLELQHVMPHNSS